MKDLELYTLTTNTTECPYNIKNENSVQQFFYDMNFQNETEKKFKRKNNKNTDFQHSNPKIMKVSQGKILNTFICSELRKILLKNKSCKF